MKHYVLIYDFVEDYLERRSEFRADHLRHAWQAVDGGELILGGALADPTDRGLMVFRSPSPYTARAFAEADPYVLHGVVTRWEVREWTTVIGNDAIAPVKPPDQ